MARSKQSPRVVEGAIGLVWRDSKLLIAHRGASEHLAGVWEFPGGKLQPEESHAEALRRELVEELGAPRNSITIGRQRTTLEYDYPDRHVVLHVFDCNWTTGEPRLDGNREWRWVEPERLRRYKFPPANRPLIDALVTEARTSRHTEKPSVRPDWPERITNRLNELSSKEWLLFQKSWFVHNPPPREKGVVVHPAKFPESLIAEFIRFFTKSGQIVLDPMLGTGSTLLAAHETGRQGIGIELNKKYAEIARERLRATGASVHSPFAIRHSPFVTRHSPLLRRSTR